MPGSQVEGLLVNLAGASVEKEIETTVAVYRMVTKKDPSPKEIEELRAGIFARREKQKKP